MAEEHPMPTDMIMVERLTRVETKLDSVLAAKQDEHHAMATRIDDHERRLRAIERRIWVAAGLAAGAGSIIGSGVVGGISGLFGA